MLLGSFLRNLKDAQREADRESATVRAFVDAWQTERGPGPVYTTDLLPIARNLVKLPVDEHAASIALGVFISKYENQVHSGYRIHRWTPSRGKTRWGLQPEANK
jgi:hypothetical protein